MSQRRSEVVLKYEDKYGDTRIVHRARNYGARLCVKRAKETPSLALTKAVSKHIGAEIRRRRLVAGFTLEYLAMRAGLKGTPKQRMYEIETNLNNGISFGTLFAIAHAFGLEAWAFLPSVKQALGSAGVGEVKERSLGAVSKTA